MKRSKRLSHLGRLDLIIASVYQTPQPMLLSIVAVTIMAHCTYLRSYCSRCYRSSHELGRTPVIHPSSVPQSIAEVLSQV